VGSRQRPAATPWWLPLHCWTPPRTVTYCECSAAATAAGNRSNRTARTAVPLVGCAVSPPDTPARGASAVAAALLLVLLLDPYVTHNTAECVQREA